MEENTFSTIPDQPVELPAAYLVPSIHYFGLNTVYHDVTLITCGSGINAHLISIFSNNPAYSNKKTCNN